MSMIITFNRSPRLNAHPFSPSIAIAPLNPFEADAEEAGGLGVSVRDVATSYARRVCIFEDEEGLTAQPSCREQVRAHPFSSSPLQPTERRVWIQVITMSSTLWPTPCAQRRSCGGSAEEVDELGVGLHHAAQEGPARRVDYLLLLQILASLRGGMEQERGVFGVDTIHNAPLTVKRHNNDGAPAPPPSKAQQASIIFTPCVNYQAAGEHSALGGVFDGEEHLCGRRISIQLRAEQEGLRLSLVRSCPRALPPGGVEGFLERPGG
ncbi:hypothetical protein GALMADRAFT_137153 [Galerina marginata CBS 339.88]|uniref:Uncharacterized protein n=1 Tax=Galerina marginata (strain CBS 339.88) TaxID=685588 RepID=A0A067T821_GALM3|nr:hypothetical protein GALMADRAFT_137153 [Galerina marginata CBS 339.88]